MIDRIIYINMKSSVARKDYMESQLSKFDIPYERFDAVCPTANDLKHPAGKYREFFERRYWPGRTAEAPEPSGRRYVESVFGCYLSQYFIHTEAMSGDWGNYVILEDDCMLYDDWYESLQDLFDKSLIPDDWDMVRSCWHWHYQSNSPVVEKFGNSHKRSKFYDKDLPEYRVDGAGGAHFTMVNKNSVKKILNHLNEEWVMGPDVVYSSHILNVYHTLVCEVDQIIKHQGRRNMKFGEL